ncbi:CDP-alcohol phosphatidyltransferase family protein [Candidatus Phytoplasma oryzae]|nr:CDP-alcohol phosphatidyltransferase family protein [Candidatus Phytoplasma oryzae]
MFLGLYNYTVFLTYLNLLSGFIGIISLSINHSHFNYASIFLLISGILDMFDGLVSRCKKKRSIQEKKYGVQIDSLADIISFGLLPILIGWSIFKQEYININNNKNFILLFRNYLSILQLFFIFFCSLYLLAVLIRLAHFNVIVDIFKKKNDYYIGIPVTFSSIIFPFLVLLQNVSKKYYNSKDYFLFLNYYFNIFPIIYLLFIFLLSFLFIFDKIKIPKKKNIFFIFGLSIIFLTLICTIYYFIKF